MPTVKPKRRYDSTRRRKQARETRTAIVEIAERLFLSEGYALTTMATIASTAGVSVETIYKAFGGKPGLVRACREKALAGQGPIHAEQRSDGMQARESDPLVVVRNWGTLTAEVAPLVAPILLLVKQAAGTDPELAALQQEMDDDRLARMTHNARYLYDGGHLRPGVTLEQAAEVLWLYSSPELYDLLVLRRRWPLDRYGGFVSDSMIAALSLQPASARRRSG